MSVCVCECVLVCVGKKSIEGYADGRPRARPGPANAVTSSSRLRARAHEDRSYADGSFVAEGHRRRSPTYAEGHFTLTGWFGGLA